MVRNKPGKNLSTIQCWGLLTFFAIIFCSKVTCIQSAASVCLRGTESGNLCSNSQPDVVLKGNESLPVSEVSDRKLWVNQLVSSCTCPNCVTTPEDYIVRWQQGAIGFNTIDCTSTCLSGSIASGSTYQELASQETFMPLRYSLNLIAGSDTLQVLANLRRAMFSETKYTVVDGLPVAPTVNSPEPNFYTGDDATIRKCLVYCADNEWCNGFIFFDGPNRKYCRLKTSNLNGVAVTSTTANFKTVSFRTTVNPPSTRIYEEVTKRAFEWLSFGPSKNWFPNTDSIVLRVFDMCTAVDAGLSIASYNYANLFQYFLTQFNTQVPILVQRQLVINLVPLNREFRRNTGCNIDIYSNDNSIKIPSCNLNTDEIRNLPCPSSFTYSLEQFCTIMTEGFQPPSFAGPPTSHVGACSNRYRQLIETYPRFADQLYVTRAFLLASVPMNAYMTGLEWFVNQTNSDSQFLTGKMWLTGQVSQGSAKTNINYLTIGAYAPTPASPPVYGSAISSQTGPAVVNRSPAASPTKPSPGIAALAKSENVSSFVSSKVTPTNTPTSAPAATDGVTDTFADDKLSDDEPTVATKAV